VWQLQVDTAIGPLRVQDSNDLVVRASRKRCRVTEATETLAQFLRVDNVEELP